MQVTGSGLEQVRRSKEDDRFRDGSRRRDHDGRLSSKRENDEQSRLPGVFRIDGLSAEGHRRLSIKELERHGRRGGTGGANLDGRGEGRGGGRGGGDEDTVSRHNALNQWLREHSAYSRASEHHGLEDKIQSEVSLSQLYFFINNCF